jgi:hypothetical protein
MTNRFFRHAVVGQDLTCWSPRVAATSTGCNQHGLQPARAATSTGCNQQVSYSSDSLSIQSLLLSPDGWSNKLRNELRAVNYKKVTAW